MWIMEKLFISVLFISTFVLSLTFAGEMYITREISDSEVQILQAYQLIYRPEAARASVYPDQLEWARLNAYIVYEFTRSSYDIRSSWYYKKDHTTYWDRLNWNPAGNYYYLKTDEKSNYRITFVAYAVKIDKLSGRTIYNDIGKEYFRGYRVTSCNAEPTVREGKSCSEALGVSWTTAAPRTTTVEQFTRSKTVTLGVVLAAVGLIVFGCFIAVLVKQCKIKKQSVGSNEARSTSVTINGTTVPQYQLENNREHAQRIRSSNITFYAEHAQGPQIEINQEILPTNPSSASDRAPARGMVPISLNCDPPPTYDEACQQYISSIPTTEVGQVQLGNLITTELTCVGSAEVQQPEITVL